VEPWIQHQLLERQAPLGQPGLMFQRWVHLLFLHWKFDPETVQRTLPLGLSVDTYEGSAWIGVVPFFMRSVRPRLLPLLSSDFLELNLRTYVRDQYGRPGVWFYSLDANHPFAVWTARLLFGLRYLHAEMQADGRDGEIEYWCRRRGSRTALEYRFQPSANLAEAKIGSLEFFLIERYRLFAVRRAQLLTGRVYHSPYQIGEAVLSKFDQYLFKLEGFQPPSGSPDSLLYSPGVDVTVYPITRLPA
jgi:uncharacterized protein